MSNTIDKHKVEAYMDSNSGVDVLDDTEVWKLVFQVTTFSHRLSVICEVLILRLINRNENLLTYL